MLAITIQQPWAWAIMHGGKNVENRTRVGTWRRAVGQRVAIHAGRQWSERGARLVPKLARRGWQEGWQDRVDRVPPGVVIGSVLVVDVHVAQGGCCTPWGERTGREAGDGTRLDVVHLVLEEPVPLVLPEPCRGALGLWTLPDRIAAVMG